MTIFRLLELNLTELLLLRTFSRDFYRAFNLELANILPKITPIMRSLSLDLNNPLYYRFTDHIPAWKPFTEEDCKQAKLAHFRRLLKFENLQPSQLDGLFGFMLENSTIYRKLLERDIYLVFSPVAPQIAHIKHNFGRHIRNNFWSCNDFDKYLTILDDIFYEVEVANEPAGINFYYEQYAKKSGIVVDDFFDRVKVFRKWNALAKVSFLQNYPVAIRVFQALVLSLASWLYDFIFYFRFLDMPVRRMVHWYPSSWISYFVYKLALFFWVFCFSCLLSPSWTIVRHIDESIVSSPATQNKIIEYLILAPLIFCESIQQFLTYLEAYSKFLGEESLSEDLVKWRLFIKECAEFFEKLLSSQRQEPVIREDEAKELDADFVVEKVPEEVFEEEFEFDFESETEEEEESGSETEEEDE